jgi:two-component system, LytTR family, response regulator
MRDSRLEPQRSISAPASRHRVLIADDEPLARSRLRRLLTARPAYEVVAVCDDGIEAAAAIASARPEILLLDVRMPGLDGLAVASTLQSLGALSPALVFVTAFDQYAAAAFDYGAVDYLRKPVDEQTLDRALGRAESHLCERTTRLQVLAVLERLTRAPDMPLRLPVRDATGTYFVAVSDVDWIDAEGNYARLHVGRHTHLVRDSMSALAAKLNAARFLRVHRSVIVNVERIARLQAHAHGEYAILLHDGTRLSSSRAYNSQIRALIG